MRYRRSVFAQPRRNGRTAILEAARFNDDAQAAHKAGRDLQRAAETFQEVRLPLEWVDPFEAKRRAREYAYQHMPILRGRAWALWYVRGALAPEYAEESALDALIQDRLKSSTVNGVEMAVAALEGWVRHRLPRLPTEEPKLNRHGAHWR